ncbi:MAG TPA: ATP-binding protein [Verrucomicrobiae bacterium]|nr:ATP-binding protein [Verrucomicrobiae bacterium]
MKWRFESDDATRAYQVRRDLLAYLATYATDDSDLAAAGLIFGELVGNVVRHAPGPIILDIRWEQGVAVLRVRDVGPGFDWEGASLPDALAESGRGLFIAHAVARGLDVRRLPDGGTEAIARLPVSLNAEFRSA